MDVTRATFKDTALLKEIGNKSQIGREKKGVDLGNDIEGIHNVV